MRETKYILVVTLIVVLTIILGSGTAFAIDPLEDERPPEVPPDAEVQTGEVLTEVTEMATKKTHLFIERIHANEAKVSDEIEIKLRITNHDAEEIRTVVSETHRPGIEYTDPIEIGYLEYQALKIPYYRWEITLPAKGSEEVMYRIKARKGGMVTFSPAILGDEYGNSFESDPTNIEINCDPNGVCEPGESFIFCPDCTTGIADGMCDGAEDARCDPDCLSEADPDCGAISGTAAYSWALVGGIIGGVLASLLVGVITYLLIRSRRRATAQ
jgi:hypothetical protein